MKSKWRIIAGVSALVIVLGVVVGLALTSSRQPERREKVKVSSNRKKRPATKPLMAVCPFDGLEAKQQAPRPLAVMVENFSSIRPQAGIGSACVVVEGLAEGGITRLMLLFGAHGADNIGPVRSARSHFVAMARGWDAIYGHVGGSIYAMKAIKDWGVMDWDQVSHGDSYERVDWAKAPHNVFTSTEKLRTASAKFQESRDWSALGFKFKPTPPMESRPEGLKKVTINFSDPLYLVEYQYDRQTNTYKRANGGRPHTDANTKLQIAPANIVIMYAPTNPIAGGSGVLDVNVTGRGRATVLRDGQVIDGTWDKPTYSSPLALQDSEGKPIALSPGQSWLEIVTPTTPVEIAQ